MIIYKITNLVNGKIYVGQTKFSVEKRFKEHTKANSPLGNAIRKYGKENFKVEVIETCKTFTELNEREIFWIEKLNCKVPNGYNVADGGAFYAVKKIEGEHYIVKTDEEGKIIGYFLLKDKFVDKFNDKRFYIEKDDNGNIKGFFPISDKKRDGENFFAMIKSLALQIGQLRLTGEQYSVLFALFNKLDFESYICVSQKELSEELRMKQANISMKSCQGNF